MNKTDQETSSIENTEIPRTEQHQNSPKSVVDESVTTQIDFNKSFGCGCFNFLDFFSRERDNDDKFVRLNKNEIDQNKSNPARDQERPDLRDDTETANIYYIKEVSDNSLLAEDALSSCRSLEQKLLSTHESRDIRDYDVRQTADEQISLTENSFPVIDTKEFSSNEGVFDAVKLSFSTSSFSDGEEDLDKSNDDCDSSTLSFDPNEFDEEEFEADYGVFDESDPSINLNPTQALPTIIEDEFEKSSSLQELGTTKFAEIFSYCG
mmetsp:Transcript_2474/g.2768  ORF Transcript_2474/g.2768 Transcript_2474/m.2768 type:complete len:265 (-) Transcript_2474:130-924(-)